MTVQDRTRLIDALTDIKILFHYDGLLGYSSERLNVQTFESRLKAKKFDLTHPSLVRSLPLFPFKIHFLTLALFLFSRFLGYALSAMAVGLCLTIFHMAQLQTLWDRMLHQSKNPEDLQSVKVRQSSFLIKFRKAAIQFCRFSLPIGIFALLFFFLALTVYCTLAYLLCFSLECGFDFFSKRFFEKTQNEGCYWGPSLRASESWAYIRIMAALAVVASPAVFYFLKFYFERLGFLFGRFFLEHSSGIGLLFQEPKLDEKPLRRWKLFDLLLILTLLILHIKFCSYRKEMLKAFVQTQNLGFFRVTRKARILYLTDSAMSRDLYSALSWSFVTSVLTFWIYVKTTLYARYAHICQVKVKSLAFRSIGSTLSE